MYYSTFALIPARLGSKRIPLKNIRNLNGHPLIAYAIQSALDAGFFDRIYVSSDSEKIGHIAKYYGARWIKRPAELATDTSPDSEWIGHVLKEGGLCYYYAIIRPTNPFRTGDTIKRAYKEWDKQSHLKAVEPVKQHPSKMWHILNGKMYNYVGRTDHLQPSQNLPLVHIQNASLEWRACFEHNSQYQPFLTKGYEGFDLNTMDDWILAESLIEKGYAKLPIIKRRTYDFTTV